MKQTIWYISKYVALPSADSVGGRGFLLMREFAELGYQSIILTSDSNALVSTPALEKSYQNELINGVQVWWLSTMKYEIAKSLRRILSWLDFEWRLWRMPKELLPKPDVVIVSSLSLLTVLNGLLLKRRFKCRLVFEVRDIWPLTLTEEGGFRWWNPLILVLGWIEKLGYRCSDVVVGTMPNLGEHVADVLGRTKPTGCIPMGVEESALLSDMQLTPGYAEKHIPVGKFMVVHAGTIGITNALDIFFECAALMQHNAKVQFLIVGDGDLRAHYQHKYDHLPNLTFAPRVPKAMVQSVLAHCDLLFFSVHVSKVWRYGQSLNKVIDYMLSGKPVVASYSGYPSMINEADSGSFVPAGDVDALQAEVERYANMSALERSQIGARGREWIVNQRAYRKLALDYLAIIFPDQINLNR